jgi:large subunit ribosomal protein L17
MDYDRRRSVVKGLLRTLLLNGKVTTTLARGRYLSRIGERVISRVREGDINAKRYLYRFFQDHNQVNQVVNALSQQLGKRTSGFLRLRKLKRRRGDDAVLVRVEFVDNIVLSATEEKDKKDEDKKK